MSWVTAGWLLPGEAAGLGTGHRDLDRASLDSRQTVDPSERRFLTSPAKSSGRFSWLLSAMGPPPHHSCWTSSASGRQHLCKVHVTTEADKVFAPLKIRLPAPKPRII